MPALVERPKMSLAMWAALKAHIMKQREKKKQEQEADAAVERLRREQEMKRKQDAMTIEEIREQLSHLQKKLAELKNEKHELFLYLKRVLNEDEKRRNEEDKEYNEMLHASHSYPPPGMALGPTNMYMIPGNTFMNRNQVLYKVGTVPQQNGTIKRSRSPSPPPPSAYPQNFGFKTHHSSYGQKPASYSNAVNSGYYAHSTASSSGTSSTMVVTNSTPPYAAYPVPHPAGPFPTQEQAKHIPAGYHVSHLAQPGMRFVGPLHQPMPHAEQKSNMQEEKYYVQPGGITSGYPVRGQPPQSRFQPPTSRNASSPIQVPARKEDLLRRNMQGENQR